MNGLFLTIVDILGIFVPGALLLGALVAMPPVWHSIDWQSIYPAALLPANRLTTIAAVSLVSYTLGFLNRLWSIRLLQTMVKSAWTDLLTRLASPLNAAFEAAIKDQVLCDSLLTLAKRLNPLDPGHYAPYFHYAKRLTRTMPGLWAEGERLEADARFTAGLFLPLLLVSIDGAWIALLYRSIPAWLVTVVSAAGVAAVVVAFPSRRNREVIYAYLLALIALRTPGIVNQYAEPTQAPKPTARPDEN